MSNVDCFHGRTAANHKSGKAGSVLRLFHAGAEFCDAKISTCKERDAEFVIVESMTRGCATDHWCRVIYVLCQAILLVDDRCSKIICMRTSKVVRHGNTEALPTAGYTFRISLLHGQMARPDEDVMKQNQGKCFRSRLLMPEQ